VTYYFIDIGSSKIYTGPFWVTGEANHLVGYRSVDNAGNKEEWKSVNIYIDKTVPNIYLRYSVDFDLYLGWIFTFTAWATDSISGMERVEYYLNGDIQKIIYGGGPEYVWIWDCCKINNFIGLIRNKEITEENIRFEAILVVSIENNYLNASNATVYGYDNAGHMNYDNPSFPFSHPFCKLFHSQNITLPNNYKGFIGNNFIFARFNTR